MEDKKVYLAQNIRNLRMLFDESQLDLAYAVGLDSPTAISNYESGHRTPKPEIRKKIAAHFRITEDQLVYTDIPSSITIDFDALSDHRKLYVFNQAAYPIICSASAIKNRNFLYGYAAHLKIVNCFFREEEIDENEYDICFDSYIEAIKEGILEAEGNLLWWFLQFECSLVNKQIAEGAHKMLKGKISSVDFLRQYYLKNMEFEVAKDEECGQDNNAEEVINEVDEIVQHFLVRLQSTELAPLAYYYSAIRYVFGMVRNENSAETNANIGSEMLWCYSDLGNEYAKKYLQTAIELFTNE